MASDVENDEDRIETAGGEPAGRPQAVLTKVHDVAAGARDTAADTIEDLRDTLGDAIGTAGAKLADVYGGAREKASTVYHDAVEQAGSVYEAARAQSAAAIEAARGKASQAKEKTVQEIDENPLAVIVGGLAVGAVLGALLPRSQREADLLAPVGGQLNGIAKGAIGAAKAAGFAKLDELGLSREAATGVFDKLVAAAGDTVRSAGTAAAGSIRESRD